MKSKVLSIVIALLLVFSMVFAASADTRAQRETAPCGHDHCTECEAHEHCTDCDAEHAHEHCPDCKSEHTYLPSNLVKIEPGKSAFDPKGFPKAPVPTELPKLPEASEIPEITDPTEVPEETETPEPTPVAEPTEVPEETEEPEPTPVAEPTEVPEETETPEPTLVAEPTEIPEKTGEPETCPHENTWDGWYWKECTYTDTGDNRTHEASGIRVNYTYCPDCDTYIAEQEEAYSAAEEHFYENGVCMYCGHINACPHENTWDFWGWKDNPTYTDTGSNVSHKESGIRIIYTACEDCGAILSSEREEESTWVVEHSYDENGVCLCCGHVNGCMHKHTYPIVYMKNPDECVYIDTGDDATHDVSGIQIVLEYCNDCGALVSEREEAYSGWEHHSYDENGVCSSCGHVNACTHDSIWGTIVWQSWKDSDQVVYIDIGAYITHWARGIRCYREQCLTCGATLSEWEGMRTISEKHSYENGVCAWCGHVNTCKHASSHLEKIEWINEEENTYIDTGDNLTHDVSGLCLLHEVCDFCGVVLSEYEDLCTEQESHYYENSVCTVCGHVNDCPHEHTEEVDGGLTELTYTDLNDREHIISSVHSIYVSCQDCGVWVDVLETEQTETEPHIYENDVCVLCGHINTCMHENRSDEFESWDYNNCTITDTGDNKTHEVSGFYNWYSICEDCGEWIVVNSEFTTGQERHNYDENGVCWMCGHVNTCAHEHTSKWYQWNWDSATFTDTGDNQTHQACGTRYVFDICEDCGMELPGYEEEYNGPANHRYDENGVCTQCGHVNTAVEISVAVSRGGSVHGAGTYHVGETVTLIAKAEKGYVFGGWKENGKLVSKEDAYTFTAEADRELTAVFFLKDARFDPVVRPILPIKPIPVNPIGIVR